MYAAVGIGGILGAILRYLISNWFIMAGHMSLAGTLCVNLTGCFLLGYLQGLARAYHLPNWLVIGVGTGFIGAFTTFSTFSNDVVSGFQKGFMLLSVSYLFTSAIGGYILVYLGFIIAAKKRKEV